MAAESEREPGGNIRETLGWLRACVEQLLKGQAKIEQDLAATNDRIDKGLAATNDRIDKGLAATNDRIGKGLAATDDRIDQRVDRIDKKVDRLMWGLIAATVVLGGGILGTLITVLLSVD